MNDVETAAFSVGGYDALDALADVKFGTLPNMIVKRGDGWHVLSESGKHLGGPYDSKAEADKRLAQVEMFKHIKKKD